MATSDGSSCCLRAESAYYMSWIMSGDLGASLRIAKKGRLRLAKAKQRKSSLREETEWPFGELNSAPANVGTVGQSEAAVVFCMLAPRSKKKKLKGSY